MYTPPFRRKWYQEWQKLRPNMSTHDDRILYKQIGKQDETNDGFDDIYMISSVNHHVCLIKMKVHARYLEWLEGGIDVSATSDQTDQMENVLYVSRSSWYDMFNVEARKEFLVALWAVMSWLNRRLVPQSEHEIVVQKQAKG
jgi:hypothetical protein